LVKSSRVCYDIFGDNTSICCSTACQESRFIHTTISKNAFIDCKLTYYKPRFGYREPQSLYKRFKKTTKLMDYDDEYKKEMRRSQEIWRHSTSIDRYINPTMVQPMLANSRFQGAPISFY